MSKIKLVICCVISCFVYFQSIVAYSSIDFSASNSFLKLDQNGYKNVINHSSNTFIRDIEFQDFKTWNYSSLISIYDMNNPKNKTEVLFTNPDYKILPSGMEYLADSHTLVVSNGSQLFYYNLNTQLFTDSLEVWIPNIKDGKFIDFKIVNSKPDTNTIICYDLNKKSILWSKTVNYSKGELIGRTISANGKVLGLLYSTEDSRTWEIWNSETNKSESIKEANYTSNFLEISNSGKYVAYYGDFYSKTLTVKDIGNGNKINIELDPDRGLYVGYYSRLFSSDSKKIVIPKSNELLIYSTSENKLLNKITIGLNVTLNNGLFVSFANNDSSIISGIQDGDFYKITNIETGIQETAFGNINFESKMYARNFFLSKYSDVLTVNSPYLNPILDLTCDTLLEYNYPGFVSDYKGITDFETSQDMKSKFYLFEYACRVTASTMANSELLFLSDSSLYSIALSPDGKYLAIGGKFGNVFIVDPNTKELLRTLRIGSYSETVACPMSNLRFSKDGKYLYGGADYSAYYNDISIAVHYQNSIWNTDTWTEDFSLSSEYRSFLNRFISNDVKYAINGLTHTIDKLNSSEKLQLDSIENNYFAFYGYSHDDKYIFALSQGKLCAWESVTGKLLFKNSEVAKYQYLAISNVSNTLVLDRADSTIVVLKFSDAAGVFDVYEETQSLKSIAVKAGETITIEQDLSIYGDVSYTLHNSIGETINYDNKITETGNSLEFTSNNLPNGVYTVNLRYGKKSKSIKILITE